MPTFKDEMKEIIGACIQRIDNNHSLQHGDAISTFLPVIWKLINKIDEIDQNVKSLDDIHHW